MASEAITRNDLTNILNELLPPEITVITYTGSYDAYIGDGYGGYIYATSIGVADLTEYLWFVGEQSSWAEFNQIQVIEANRLTIRTWRMNSPTTGQVILLRNTMPSPFRLIGIKKP